MTKENNLNELLKQAKSLIEAKEFEKAILAYEAILKEDNKEPEALSHLAILYLMKHRYIDGINMTHRSFEVTIPIIGDYQNLATAYNALKDFKNSIKAYEEIIKINPKTPEIYKNLGSAQMKILENDSAIDSFKKAL